MAAKADERKWEGKLSANLKPTPEAVWPLLEDFCNIHKLLPAIDTCYKVDGADGLVRYCATTPPDGGAVRWCREKLVAIDPVGKWLKYEIMDNNFGFKEYEATLKLVPIDGGDDPSGCRIEWSFVADPPEGLGYADFCAYVETNLQGIAKNIEKELELSG